MQRFYVVFWGMHLSSTSLDEHLFTSRLIDFDVVEYILIKDNFCVSGFVVVVVLFFWIKRTLNKYYFHFQPSPTKTQGYPGRYFYYGTSIVLDYLLLITCALLIFSYLWEMLRLALSPFLSLCPIAMSNTEVIYHLLSNLNYPGFSS